MISPELKYGVYKICDYNYKIRINFIEIIIKYYTITLLVIVIPLGNKKRTRRKLGVILIASDSDNNSCVGYGDDFIDFLDNHKPEILKFFAHPQQHI